MGPGAEQRRQGAKGPDANAHTEELVAGSRRGRHHFPLMRRLQKKQSRTVPAGRCSNMLLGGWQARRYMLSAWAADVKSTALFLPARSAVASTPSTLATPERAARGNTVHAQKPGNGLAATVAIHAIHHATGLQDGTCVLFGQSLFTLFIHRRARRAPDG